MSARPYQRIARIHILELKDLLAKFQITHDNRDSAELVMKALPILDAISRAVEEDVKSLDYSI